MGGTGIVVVFVQTCRVATLHIPKVLTKAPASLFQAFNGLPLVFAAMVTTAIIMENWSDHDSVELVGHAKDLRL